MSVNHQIPSVTLHDGNTIPIVGLGALRIANDDIAPVIFSALAAGYRHIDGAAGYENERGIGQALAQLQYNQGQARQSLWITTKVRDSQQGYDQTLTAFDQQLHDLQLEYVDMYMIHWPTPFNWRADETWRAMSRLRQEGRIRSIGVCNFLPEHLERLYSEVGEYPVINQIELHPTYQQRDVVVFCRKQGIAVEAYSPLARGLDLKAGGGVFETIAQHHGVSVAQVVLRWHIEHGIIIVPKSVNAERQQENLDLFSFHLTADEIEQIDALDGDGMMGHDPRTFSYA